MTERLRLLGIGAVGLLWGAGLERMGFADYGELHRMFTFQSFRLLLSFAGGVAVAMAGFALLRNRAPMPRRAVHSGTFVGGLLFGVGWVLTGACPSVAGVALASGQVAAVPTLLGIAAGSWAYPRVHARFFRWDPTSCGD
jgi:uncharacterized membrane protein YedE/YeeE